MHEEKNVDSEPIDVEDIIVDDLSSSMEEMDIECVEAEEEEKTLKERSRLMDKKKKSEEKEASFRGKQRDALERKRKADSIRVEISENTGVLC